MHKYDGTLELLSLTSIMQVIAPVTKYALTLTPVAFGIEELLPSAYQSYNVSILIRTILAISTLIITLAVPYFSKTLCSDFHFLYKITIWQRCNVSLLGSLLIQQNQEWYALLSHICILVCRFHDGTDRIFTGDACSKFLPFNPIIIFLKFNFLTYLSDPFSVFCCFYIMYIYFLR